MSAESPSPQPPPLTAKERLQREVSDDVGVRMLIPVGRSVAAVTAGYLGLLSILLVPAPFALIVSIVAIRDLKRRRAVGRKAYGMGRAVFGLIMGLLGTLALLAMVWALLTQ